MHSRSEIQTLGLVSASVWLIVSFTSVRALPHLKLGTCLWVFLCFRLDSSTLTHSKLMNMFRFKAAVWWYHFICSFIIRNKSFPIGFLHNYYFPMIYVFLNIGICWDASINPSKLQILLFPVWQWVNSELFCLMQLGKKKKIVLSKGTSKNLVKSAFVSPVWCSPKRSLKNGFVSSTSCKREVFCSCADIFIRFSLSTSLPRRTPSSKYSSIVHHSAFALFGGNLCL